MSLGSLVDGEAAGDSLPPLVLSLPAFGADYVVLLPAGVSPDPDNSHLPFSCRITSPTRISSFCFLSADSSVTRSWAISVTVYPAIFPEVGSTCFNSSLLPLKKPNNPFS